MKFLLFIFILLSLKGSVFGQNFKSRYNFDSYKNWEWNELIKRADKGKTIKDIEQIKKLLSINEARFIFSELSKLHRPEDIKGLSEIEKNQFNRGGGFYGIIPAYFSNPDTIPLPSDFDSIVKAALYFAKIRDKNFSIISDSNFDYPLKFSNSTFPELAENKFFPNMRLELDFSVIRDLLNYFNKKNITFKEALDIASTKVFSEMLKHRKELGYVPEPLPDSTDLAKFIFDAASKSPLDMIWKWLNPWNDLCLADLYLLQDEYQKLLNTLTSHMQDISDHVLSRISLFFPYNIDYRGRLSFAVNWGIRSWATENSLGTNIVQFKDNYNKMFRTITHETFHRVQLKVCPVDSSKGGKRTFEDLTYHNSMTKEDRVFYEALSYIMLEGTATFVGGVDEKWRGKERMLEGKRLLEQFTHEVYAEHNFESSAKLLNRGLKSNGPFYALGYFMSKMIVREKGEKEIGLLLKRGCVSFFRKYIEVLDKGNYSKDLYFNPDFVYKIKKLEL